MRKFLIIGVLLLMFLPTWASHIVGGEFELRFISGNTYRLTLILYFDSINGSVGARDSEAFVRFFRKRDNMPVFLTPGNASSGFLVLPFDGVQRSVPYTNDECQIEELVTNKLVYTATVVLRNDVFNDPEGYYVSWERCCRNYGITNIFSLDPEVNPLYAGQTFYLEFPPVVKNGQPFINSTPRLFPPLSDYACPNIPYFVDFAGIDDDGDSLVYSLVTPLNTITADALPPPIMINNQSVQVPRPGPYPEVAWRPGFGLDNIMKGVTNLEISSDGFLSVTPGNQGLYVFAVRCEEFRDGIKIGEARRDFQMLVLDACPVPVPPHIEGKALGSSDFSTNGTLEVFFDGTETDAERCFEVRVTDPSTLLPDDGFQENVRIRAIPIGFKKNLSEVLPVVTNASIVNGGGAEFTICLPVCPYVPSGNFQIGIVAFDDACAVPLRDTLIVTVHLDPPPNAHPLFSNPGNGTEIAKVVSEGSAVEMWPLQASDADGELISYRLVPVDFALEDFGMSFSGSLSGTEPGPINKTLSWDPKCDVYDFTEKTSFELYFIVEDVDMCSVVHADTTYFNLSITDFSQITPPVIDNALESLADTIEVSLQMYGAPLVLDVTGSDVDNTPILLRANGVGFSASAYGATFPVDFDQGAVASQFQWELLCDSINLEVKNVFEFQLMVVDSLNKCRFYKADTLLLRVHIDPAEEEAFIPPNVFSPNSDDKNAFFGMVKYHEDTGEFISILPDDNCFGKFVNIHIYDRWGKQVYESAERNFRWYGEGMPTGVYYYYIRYSNRGYKGIVSLRL